MAVGGEGAPLVQRNFLLYGEDHQQWRCRISEVLNVDSSKKGDEKVIAFDTGSGNMMIDEAVRTSSMGRSTIRMIFGAQTRKMIPGTGRRAKRASLL